MSKMKNAIIGLKNRTMLRLAGIKPEKESGMELIEVLGLIAVAVVIIFLFKDYLIEIFNSFMKKENTELDKLFNAATKS